MPQITSETLQRANSQRDHGIALESLRGVQRGLLDSMTALVDGAKAENRDLLASEAREMDRLTLLHAEAEVLAGSRQEQRNRTVDAMNRSIAKHGVDVRPQGEVRDDRGGPAPGWLPGWNEYRTLEARAVAEGTGSAGGFFVPTEHANTFVDRLAAQSVFLNAGPRIFTMSTDRLEVPKIGSSVTAEFVAENTAITASDPTFAQVVLTPKKAAALTLASNESLADSRPELREVLAYDHLRSVALLLDLQMLQGDGTGNGLIGVRNFSGVTDTELGAGDGAIPTLDDVADAIERLETDDATATAIFMAPRTWATFRKLVDVDERYQLAPDPTMESRRQLFGVPVRTSSQIAVDETTGTSTDTSWIAVVDMSQIAVGRRDGVRLEYSRDYAFDADQTAIRTISRWDVAPINAGGVELITGVRNTA